MSSRQKLKSFRNQPKQERSRATVEAILDGAVRVFDRHSPELVTTTRVAEAAGVSVGTLYQYFSNREQIVDALQQREFERATQLLGELLVPSSVDTSPAGAGALDPPRPGLELGHASRIASQTPELALRQSPEWKLSQAVVAGLLGLYRAAPGLHRFLALEGLRSAPGLGVQAFDRKIVELLRVFFEATNLRVERPNKQVAAFILYQTVRACLLAAILEEPAGVTDELLVTEISDMVAAHLVR